MSKYTKEFTLTNFASWRMDPNHPDALASVQARIDVYDVCLIFGIACPATQHALKKLLCAGQRGAKTKVQDLEEAISSIERAIEIAKAGAL